MDALFKLVKLEALWSLTMESTADVTTMACNTLEARPSLNPVTTVEILALATRTFRSTAPATLAAETQ